MIDRFSVEDAHFAIARDLGCNLFSWVVADREMLYRPAGFPHNGHFYTGGNPLLFPALGRTWDRSVDPPEVDTYRVAGRYDTLSMPIHGFIDRCQIAAPTVKTKVDHVTAIYEITIPESVARECYPWQVALQIMLTMTKRCVQIELRLHNRGNVPAPYSFGSHPYLAISNPGRDGISLSLPATRMIDLDPKLLVPTGEMIPLTEPFRLKPDTSYDNVYSRVTGEDAVLTDCDARRHISIGYDSSITQFVIYAPAGAPFVCVEPWTAGLDGFSRLASPGSGAIPPLLAVEPEREVRFTVSLSVRKF